MTNEEYFQSKLKMLTEDERKEFLQLKFKYQKLSLGIAEFQEMWSNFSKTISEKYKEDFTKLDKQFREEFEKNPFNFFNNKQDTKNNNTK